jgi:hypothetical protein
LQAHAQSGLSDLGESTVSAVRDHSTLVLGDGRAVKLSGIEAGPNASSALRELALGRASTESATAESRPSRP